LLKFYSCEGVVFNNMKEQFQDKRVVVIEPAGLERLIEVLSKRGFHVLGPILRDGAIVYDRLASIADLPAGWTDEQDGGTYRLRRRSDNALFGYAVGPYSWKKFLFPPVQRLWRARREGEGFEMKAETSTEPRYAFFGVRPCELQAIEVLDRVFGKDTHIDPLYLSRRENIFVVAVNCGHAGGTCFCVSMQTGPRATFGYDLVLTEVVGNGSHYFVLETGSEAGTEIMSEIPYREAQDEEVAAADRVLYDTAGRMGRELETPGIKELLYRNYENPRWEDVAKRCLTCANCTFVCPTCFCSTVEDVTDLGGEHAERWRPWDFCFTMDFSYIHGGSVRSSTKSRYRQWMTHKLATWIDQFGTSGCVGCGRCITWCPVGIDITEEARAIRENER
jgi:sulfhydrogenase subunit beta (sulfur reductase)